MSSLAGVGSPPGRRERLALARLYVVSDARQRQGDLVAFLNEILAAGTDVVQLREKDAEAGDLLRWGFVFREASARHGALFIVNDRPDVARTLGADGVHLGQNDLPPAAARAILGPDALIGLSTHAAGEYSAASAQADYLCVGPVHATPTKPGRPGTGLQLVSHAASLAASGGEVRPWFAVGGISEATLPAVLAAGASRAAVVRAVGEARAPATAVLRLRRLIETRGP